MGIFGVSGAIVLVRFAYLQPYVLAAAGLLLGLAFWFAYRPNACPQDEACDPAARRRLRWFVWGGTITAFILAIAALFPQLFI